jgi:hypothetical protein
LDDAEGPIIRRPRARENYGEQVCKATLAVRARRARLKAVKEAAADA